MKTKAVPGKKAKSQNKSKTKSKSSEQIRMLLEVIPEDEPRPTSPWLEGRVDVAAEMKKK